jgi:hypothetical protein
MLHLAAVDDEPVAAPLDKAALDRRDIHGLNPN